MKAQDDQQARLDALNIKDSFIVQAPAGSGKTELLTQRFLALLGNVQKPDNILAITFTRKAAQEMRERIIHRMRLAASGYEGESEHEKLTLTLAKAALAQNEKQGWGLLNNPDQLKLQTIDSFCKELAASLPLTSELGTLPEVTDNACPLYQQAAERLIRDAEAHDYQKTLATLLTHLDNNLQYLQTLIIDMLGARDQWLSELYQHQDKTHAHFKRTLKLINHHYLNSLDELIDPPLQTTLFNMLAALRPETRDCDLKKRWLMLAELFLNQNGEWRKQFTAREGLPQSKGLNKAQKEALAEQKETLLRLSEHLQAIPDAQVKLQGVKTLPPLDFAQAQWIILQALFDLLPIAAATLRLIFLETGKIDFTEISLAAIKALGHYENPSDFALALDYSIQHILVDEFQDTNKNQMHLLRLLTQAWTETDHKTLFLVGDPMQSIYRFRHAEVGLFLTAQTQGIGQIQPHFLNLTYNFRSQATLIDWFNTAFSAIFPQQSESRLSAVHYHSAIAAKAASTEEAVSLHIADDTQSESDFIAKTVATQLKAYPNEKIGILVRAKSHARPIIDALKKAELNFQAVDIEPLSEKPWILDLLSLLRAITHLGDRLAWLSLLRAPFCGLTLKDLLAIAKNKTLTIWQALNDNNIISTLSPEGQARATFLKTVLAQTLDHYLQHKTSSLIAFAWKGLQANSAYQDEIQNDIDGFFQYLLNQENESGLIDSDKLTEELSQAFADNSTEAPIEIMTIHKSKGLEFDTVILPAAHKQNLKTDTQLLVTSEEIINEEFHTLLSPLPATGEEDGVYRYIQNINRQKNEFENRRLLYVAATRAKKQLIFTAVKSEEKDAKSSSFLDYLEPYLDAARIPNNNDSNGINERFFVRTKVIPHYNDQLITSLREKPDFNTRDEEAFLGTLIHYCLEQLSQHGAEKNRIAPSIHDCEQRIRYEFTDRDEQDRAIRTLHRAIDNILSDERGRWILKAHDNASAEYALSHLNEGRLEHIIIDRMFVDEAGVRWIIDYKSAARGKQPIESFLNEQAEHYRPQLNRYRDIASRYFPEPIQTALYFPLDSLWLTVKAE